jgi:hypothetical protein
MARQISWRGMLSPDGAGDGRPVRETWRPRAPVQPPRSVVEAVRTMQLGAALALVEVVRAIVTRGALRSAFAGEAAHQGRSVDASDLDYLVTVALTISVVVGLLSALVWFWQSRLAARGSRWGRVSASALFALGLLVFAGGLLPAGGPLARTLALVSLGLGAFAVVRLWHRDTSAWIRYQSTPQGS